VAPQVPSQPPPIPLDPLDFAEPKFWGARTALLWVDFRLMNVDFRFLEVSLPGAGTQFQAHITYQQSSFGNHQSSSHFS
jgi:hypothetical protein